MVGLATLLDIADQTIDTAMHAGTGNRYKYK